MTMQSSMTQYVFLKEFIMLIMLLRIITLSAGVENIKFGCNDDLGFFKLVASRPTVILHGFCNLENFYNKQM